MDSSDIAWLADGIHIFAGLLSIASFYFFVRGYFKNATAGIFWAHMLGFLGVLTRDEGLALYLIALTFPLVYPIIFNERSLSKSTLFIRYLIPGAILGSLYLIARKVFIPPSELFPAEVPIHRLIALYSQNYASSFCETFNFLGLLERNEILYCLGVIAVLIVFGLLSAHSNRKLLFLFAIILLISLAPMGFLYRQNLLLNPSLFACGIVALSLESIFMKKNLIASIVLGILLCAALSFSFMTNRICQESLHPCSAATMMAHEEFFICAKGVSVPIERRIRIMKKLDSLGFRDLETYTVNEFRRTFYEMTKNSIPSEPRDDAVFISKRGFLGYGAYPLWNSR